MNSWSECMTLNELLNLPEFWCPHLQGFEIFSNSHSWWEMWMIKSNSQASRHPGPCGWILPITRLQTLQCSHRPQVTWSSLPQTSPETTAPWQLGAHVPLIALCARGAVPCSLAYCPAHYNGSQLLCSQSVLPPPG